MRWRHAHKGKEYAQKKNMVTIKFGKEDSGIVWQQLQQILQFF